MHQPDETPQPLLQDNEPTPMMPATPLAPPTPNPHAPPTPYMPPMLSPPTPAPTPVPPHTPLPMTPTSMGIQDELSQLGIAHQTSQDMIAQGRI